MSKRINIKRRVTAILEGARSAGYNSARLEIDKDDKIVIITGQSEHTDVNALDTWMPAKNARAA